MNCCGIGIIGCGNVLSAYRAAIDALRLRGWAEVIVICGRPNQRRQAAAEFPSGHFVLDEQLVLNNPAVDVVLILTSMTEHSRLCRAALNAGKHVVVEKPMALDLREADQLIRLAQLKKRYLAAAPFTMLSPTFQRMGEQIFAGTIGKPCLARARYGWAGPWWSEWFYKKGCGCLSDLGVYCITSLTGLLGPAKKVMAMAGVAIPYRIIRGKRVRVQAEDNAQVLLDFGKQTFGVITTGFTIQKYRGPALEIYGTQGTIQMLGDDWDPNGYELWLNSVGAWQVFEETSPDWPWTDGLRELVQCVREKRRMRISPEQSRHVLEILIAAKQSARTGKSVVLKTRFTPLRFRETAGSEKAHLLHDRSREHR